MLSVYHGDAFYPSEKHSWSNFLVKKKKKDRKRIRQEDLASNLFVHFSTCNPETAILSSVWKTFSWKRAQSAVSVLLRNTHFYCSRLYLSKGRGLDPHAKGTNWDGLWCLCEIQAQPGAMFGGEQCIQPPALQRQQCQSQPWVLPDPRAAFLPQPTIQPSSPLHHHSKHFGGKMSGLWEPQCHLSEKLVFPCPLAEVTPNCCWRIHIYNDRSFVLTSSPPQRVYYWNANSTIAVMTLFYKAHISGTFANGLKKWSS